MTMEAHFERMHMYKGLVYELNYLTSCERLTSECDLCVLLYLLQVVLTDEQGHSSNILPDSAAQS